MTARHVSVRWGKLPSILSRRSSREAVSRPRWCVNPLRRRCWASPTKLMLPSLSPAKIPSRACFIMIVCLRAVVSVVV